jgi:hypothetical protein
MLEGENWRCHVIVYQECGDEVGCLRGLSGCLRGLNLSRWVSKHYKRLLSGFDHF